PYPWAFNETYELISAITPAIGAVHVVEKFRGQANPDVPIVSIMRDEFDRTLLLRLLDEWITHFGTDKPPISSVRLFRSLNVAYQAMRVPGARGVTLFDFGRSMMLWASAFEILVNLGTGVMRSHVCDLLEKNNWVSDLSKKLIYPRSWKTTE